jgi:D-serine deaminase-like pyridoxal phosphate-dependent protein
MRASIGIAAGAPALLFPANRPGDKLRETETRLRPGAENLKGITKADLPTPSLVLDLDRLERNIAAMARHAKESGVSLRPHAKTHKCPEIALRQMRAGALGICTATIHEAEVMADAGLSGLLITSELVGVNKIQRLIRLTSRKPDTMTVADSPLHAEQLEEAAAAAKVTLNVLVDIDPFGRRTGALPGDLALELAQKIDGLPHLKLRGVHGYSGASSHVKGFDERKEHSERYMRPVLDTFARMKQNGLPAEIMSGASTGTYNIDPKLEGLTEMQVGSYVFMDVDYRLIGGRDGAVYADFEPSLTVLTTVISKNHTDQATVDAGFKAFATDRQFGPEVVGIEGVGYRFAGDEHGILELRQPSRDVRLGDRFELIVPHCDPNVNLYDRIFCVRGEQVEAVWAVAARGHS